MEQRAGGKGEKLCKKLRPQLLDDRLRVSCHAQVHLEPASWLLAHKLKPGKKFDMHELPIVRDYESGKVTKEELDALSTCDMHAAINDGLSDASRADAHVYETEEAL